VAALHHAHRVVHPAAVAVAENHQPLPDHLYSIPQLRVRYLLDHLQEETLGNVDLSSVRIITNGAEPISADLCEDLPASLPNTGCATT
jgi:hypothetical protein